MQIYNLKLDLQCEFSKKKNRQFEKTLKSRTSRKVRFMGWKNERPSGITTNQDTSKHFVTKRTMKPRSQSRNFRSTYFKKISSEWYYELLFLVYCLCVREFWRLTNDLQFVIHFTALSFVRSGRRDFCHNQFS